VRYNIPISLHTNCVQIGKKNLNWTLRSSKVGWAHDHNMVAIICWKYLTYCLHPCAAWIIIELAIIIIIIRGVACCPLNIVPPWSSYIIGLNSKLEKHVSGVKWLRWGNILEFNWKGMSEFSLLGIKQVSFSGGK